MSSANSSVNHRTKRWTHPRPYLPRAGPQTTPVRVYSSETSFGTDPELGSRSRGGIPSRSTKDREGRWSSHFSAPSPATRTPDATCRQTSMSSTSLDRG